jgi:hypothetical protein
VDDVKVEYIKEMNVDDKCGNVSVEKMMIDSKEDKNEREMNGLKKIKIE